MEVTFKDLVSLVVELKGLDKPESEKETKLIHGHMIGQKVLVRTYSAGVHFGTLVEKCGQQAILADSRRIYSWVKAATLSQLAMEGSKNIDECKIAMTIDEILLDRVIEVMPMTEKAIENLYGAKEWKC